MLETRRKFIQKTIRFTAYVISATGGLFNTVIANAAWPADNFKETQLNDTLQQVFGDQKFIETNQIQVKLPKIAENGAVVPIIITSNLEKVETFTILAEKNPAPLVAQFTLANETEAYVSARIKMAETSDIIVIAKADDIYYSKRIAVKVTIGGCGGG
jgi:sulfur-oxidizing protein SoxY